MEKIAVKSAKAMFHLSITIIVLILIGGYLLFTYDTGEADLSLAGYIILIVGLLTLLINIPSIFSPSTLIEKNEQEEILIHQLFVKTRTIKLSDITEVKSLITLKKYLRPYNMSFYTYGTLIIKTSEKTIYVLNVEDLKDVEASLIEMIKL